MAAITDSINITVGEHIVRITKLDNDEYEFHTTHEYLEYWGKSFMKLFAFIDDISGLGEYAACYTIDIDFFSDYIILAFPVPFTKKSELVRLNKPAIDKITELSIVVKKQECRIKNLEQQIQILNADLVERKTPALPSHVHLNIVYDKERGAYIDYDGYYNQPGANKKNVEFLMQYINDEFGFGNVPILWQGTQYHAGKLIQAGESATFSSLFSSLDEFVQNIGKCYNSVNGQQFCYNACMLVGSLCFNPVEKFSKMDLFGIPNCFGSYANNKNPYDALLQKFNLPFFIIGCWSIPCKTIEYVRIPKLFDGQNSYYLDRPKLEKAVIENCTTHSYHGTTLADYMVKF